MTESLHTVPAPCAGIDAERSELQAVLSSPLFSRAPSLILLLTYICEKHFAGEAHLVKESNIAIEALGRPDTFNQKRDSIVRVELHRLRRRLAECYLSDGAGHALQITIPRGSYAPVFVQIPQEAAQESIPEAAPTPLPQPFLVPAPPPAANPRPRWTLIAAILAALTLASLLLFHFLGSASSSA